MVLGSPLAAVTDWFQWMMERYDKIVIHRDHTEVKNFLDRLYYPYCTLDQDEVRDAMQRLASLPLPDSVKERFCRVMREDPTNGRGRIKFTKAVKEDLKDRMCRTLKSNIGKGCGGCRISVSAWYSSMQSFSTKLTQIYCTYSKTLRRYVWCAWAQHSRCLTYAVRETELEL